MKYYPFYIKIHYFENQINDLDEIEKYIIVFISYKLF